MPDGTPESVRILVNNAADQLVNLVSRKLTNNTILSAVIEVKLETVHTNTTAVKRRLNNRNRIEKRFVNIRLYDRTNITEHLSATDETLKPATI